MWTDQRIPDPVSCRCPEPRMGLLETPPRWHATVYTLWWEFLVTGFHRQVLIEWLRITKSLKDFVPVYSQGKRKKADWLSSLLCVFQKIFIRVLDDTGSTYGAFQKDPITLLVASVSLSVHPSVRPLVLDIHFPEEPIWWQLCVLVKVNLLLL